MMMREVAMADRLHKPEAKGSRGDVTPLPRIVDREGVEYIAGTSVSVRCLARARRLGSTEADLRAAFSDMPPLAL
jgi:uncharacterized protein (DUF433 family)